MGGGKVLYAPPLLFFSALYSKNLLPPIHENTWWIKTFCYRCPYDKKNVVLFALRARVGKIAHMSEVMLKNFISVFSSRDKLLLNFDDFNSLNFSQ